MRSRIHISPILYTAALFSINSVLQNVYGFPYFLESWNDLFWWNQKPSVTFVRQLQNIGQVYAQTSDSPISERPRGRVEDVVRLAKPIHALVYSFHRQGHFLGNVGNAIVTRPTFRSVVPRVDNNLPVAVEAQNAFNDVFVQCQKLRYCLAFRFWKWGLSTEILSARVLAFRDRTPSVTKIPIQVHALADVFVLVTGNVSAIFPPQSVTSSAEDITVGVYHWSDEPREFGHKGVIAITIINQFFKDQHSHGGGNPLSGVNSAINPNPFLRVLISLRAFYLRHVDRTILVAWTDRLQLNNFTELLS